MAALDRQNLTEIWRCSCVSCYANHTLFCSFHQRSKSAVARALQRISSRSEVPRLSATAEQGNASPSSVSASPVDVTGSSSTVLLSPPTASPRVSMQSTSRARLNTTISRAAMSSTGDEDAASAGPSNVAGVGGAPGIEQSVKLFKVFEVLRNGDTAAVSRALKADDAGQLDGTTMLHLAIQCAQQPIVECILSEPMTDINAIDREGNTPLHIAANLGRTPVVTLLLKRSDLNDNVSNAQGKTALDLARNPDIFQQLQLSRNILVDESIRKVHRLIGQGDYDSLEQLLGETHLRSVLDVNGPELATDAVTTESGGTLLHEAARKKDLKLAQLLLLNGADPFRRDRKGKLPQDVTKDDRTRAILKKSPAAQVAQRIIQEKTVLGDMAQLGGVPTTETGPGGRESREMKGYLKKWTNYTSGYKLRWFVLEDGVLSYYKHQDDAGSACRGAINMRIAQLHMDPKDKLMFEIHGKSSVKYSLKANHQIEAKRWFWALNNAIRWSKDEVKEENKRQEAEGLALREARSEQLERKRSRESEMAQTSAGLFTGTNTPFGGSIIGDHSAYEPSDSAFEAGIPKSPNHRNAVMAVGDLDGDEELADDASGEEVHPANKDAFSITAQSAKLQLDLLEHVSAALQAQIEKKSDMLVSNPVMTQALSSYDTAVGNLKGLLIDLLRISRDHEAHWQYRLEREQNIRRLWETSMARVATEQEELETRFGESEDKRKRTKRALRDVLEGGPSSMPAASGAEDQAKAVAMTANDKGRRPTIADFHDHDILEDDSDDDDEFFDAVDAGEVEVVEEMPPSTLLRTSAEPAIIVENERAGGPAESVRSTEIAKSFRGYEDGLRKRLKLDADDRPKASLWGILKSMIGKDMTRMTLPVSFNEPTSLLHCVVQDMEYTDLLNTAADRADSAERLVYVAGFAASEYASTIGRVAKPFNPLLGETYEYCRPDLGYRFFIEQVSHHPPVGAAHAESPKWTYYGESAVKSKFYGKSFEFNPLGTWFLHLRTPHGGEELYTWKKVTSSVVGIITGNPSVDNYGQMEVKNWTTGEVGYLDFRPKGWKASSAHQVVGKVCDTQGRTRWSIGGRWNEKIYARLTPGYETELLDQKDTAKAILVWEAHERPAGIPFNITPFVITLNDPAPKLLPFLPPTDSRLRPDQRAMEEGEYDFAAEEKHRVEEAQRSRRRAREAYGKEFRPRWFKKTKHPVTGESYWDFSGDYWKIREAVVEGNKSWEEEGLEPIFGGV